MKETMSFKPFFESKLKDAMLKARERPAIVATKAARLEKAKETHKAIQAALNGGKIVSIRARKTPDFEAPAVDHHLVMHQGSLMLVDPRGMGKHVSLLTASDTGHIVVNFKEKNRRAPKPIYLHAGHGGVGDMIETDVDSSPYRVSMVGGNPQFRGLPDLSEETSKFRIMNLLEQRLEKKKIGDVIKAVGGGLALAGAVIGGHQAYLRSKPKPIKTEIVAPQENIGSGKVVAQTKQEQPTSKAHTIASELIREREGFRSTAYNKDGRWTIGHGNTRYSNGTPVRAGDTITREQADKEHEHHIQHVVIPKLEKTIPHWGTMNDHQRASLISFSYNVGENFYGHKNYETVTHALSHPDNWHKVPSAMALYTKALDPKTGKKVELRGLKIRREQEGKLWEKPVS